MIFTKSAMPFALSSRAAIPKPPSALMCSFAVLKVSKWHHLPNSLVKDTVRNVERNDYGRNPTEHFPRLSHSEGLSLTSTKRMLSFSAEGLCPKSSAQITAWCRGPRCRRRMEHECDVIEPYHFLKSAAACAAPGIPAAAALAFELTLHGS
ncbi:hypothetical protein CPB84DRAFT_400788 [Gymnopilus junonius]|uniref:Uncharacterized protein n=1 Tax=Gymnopilus junonius TaxID=109634 RepID=A0A9P5TR37_GYMJU|nr:hypothetical protein CPB84DRAFT_400788 [Gymnopilus junonius]